MDVRKLGSSVSKVNGSLESLARTDDMLAVIGLIMLFGVIISAYGSFWQGRLAASQFKQQCSTDPNTQNAVEQKKTIKYTITVIVATLLIMGLMVYVFRKQFKGKSDITATA
jgi:predicted histidine transporter YuiF (NhaC family)